MTVAGDTNEMPTSHTSRIAVGIESAVRFCVNNTVTRPTERPYRVNQASTNDG